jgi:hypothetical protein
VGHDAPAGDVTQAQLLAAIAALATKLDKRCEWLDYEIRNGGNQAHLSARYAECAHIASLVRGLPNDAAEVRS